MELPNKRLLLLNFSGLSLSRRSDGGGLAGFGAAADTVFQNGPFLCNRMQRGGVLFSETRSFDGGLLFDFVCVA